MNVRAKFKVQSVTHTEANGSTIVMGAIHGNDNKTWSKWTPSGTLTLQCCNPGATEQFKPGACVFLDLSEAPEKESDEVKP
jgi:hypothetical protein